MLSVRLPKKLEEHLDALCAKTERSRSFYVKKALVRYFEDQAEMEWATKAYKEFVDSGKKTVSWEEVKERNGL
jgi:RHH-type transcriptional regulator, rel operon repressor / antitoxin RelB